MYGTGSGPAKFSSPAQDKGPLCPQFPSESWPFSAPATVVVSPSFWVEVSWTDFYPLRWLNDSLGGGKTVKGLLGKAFKGVAFLFPFPGSRVGVWRIFKCILFAQIKVHFHKSLDIYWSWTSTSFKVCNILD